MTKPRSHYVDPKVDRFYHLSSRCVRRSWLLGIDPLTGNDYNHRKRVFLNHLQHLSQHFTIDVMGYAVMSNHFHLVVSYHPTENQRWSAEEVARRWCCAFHGKPLGTMDVARTVEEFDLSQTLRYHEILLDPERIARCRAALGSLSRFMQHLKQPFAVWANHEDNCTGHFFESRFYSGALLEENDLLACMAYVDLNPVEAGMARSLNQAQDTSIHERLYAEKFTAADLDAYLAPLWEKTIPAEPRVVSSGSALRITLKRYAQQLNLAIVYLQHPDATIQHEIESWMARLINRERRARRTHQPEFYEYA